MNGLFGFEVISELIGVCTLLWSRRSAVSFIVAMSDPPDKPFDLHSIST